MIRMVKAQLLSIIALLFLLCGCNNASVDKVIMLSDPPTPEQVVRGFYHTYLEYAAGGELETYYQNRIYQEYNFLDQEFINYLDNLHDQTNSFNYDPVLCTKYIPEKLKIIDAEIIMEDIILNVISDLENHSFQVHLSPQEEHYVIHKVSCN